jgi:hypothetical protein
VQWLAALMPLASSAVTTIIDFTEIGEDNRLYDTAAVSKTEVLWGSIENCIRPSTSRFMNHIQWLDIRNPYLQRLQFLRASASNGGKGSDRLVRAHK